MIIVGYFVAGFSSLSTVNMYILVLLLLVLWERFPEWDGWIEGTSIT